MLLTDTTFRSAAKHAGTLLLLSSALSEPFLIALLWVVAVLVHGVWYFCCKTDEKNINNRATQAC